EMLPPPPRVGASLLRVMPVETGDQRLHLGVLQAVNQKAEGLFAQRLAGAPQVSKARGFRLDVFRQRGARALCGLSAQRCKCLRALCDRSPGIEAVEFKRHGEPPSPL